MKVRVKRSDINEGRFKAGLSCGCPIWHALQRKLAALGLYETSWAPLSIPSTAYARLGKKVRMSLPDEAKRFQDTLIDDPEAKVRPFTFETSLEAK